MSFSFLYGAMGQLKVLKDRMTSARAANLDNLDTTISSRAVASTALSNAVWSNARASALDNAATLANPIMAAPIALVPASPIGGSAFASDVLASVSGLSNGSTASTTYADIVNYSGSGILEFAAVRAYASATASLKLVIDGVTLCDFTQSAPGSSNHRAAAVVGAYANLASNMHGLAFSQIPFHSSLQIQGKTSGTYDAKIYYRYRKTS